MCVRLYVRVWQVYDYAKALTREVHSMKRRLLFFSLMFMIAVFSAYAHSGGTDSKGGHYNRSTGEYHYHHGYSAHQHPNGVCPYETSKSTPTRKPAPTFNYSYTPVTTVAPRATAAPEAHSHDEGSGVGGFVAGTGFGAAGLYLLNKYRSR